MRRDAARLVAVMGAVALLLASCGGSSKSASSGTTTVTSATTTTSTTTTAPPQTTPTTVPPRWSALPAAPIAGRVAGMAVWTGTEVLVWGGVIRKGAPNPTVAMAGDGAAYDPRTRTWRVLAPAPSGVLGDGGYAAAWTGDEAVFWVGNSPSGPVGGAVYDPARNTWRRLSPGPLTSSREGYLSVWTGTELLIMGGNSGDGPASPVAAAVNPRTGSWRLLPAFNRFPGLRLAGVTWNGHDLYGSGTYSLCPQLGSACHNTPSVFFAFDPATGGLQRFDLAHAPQSSLAVIGSSGTDVVLATTGPARPRIVGYDPSTGVWSEGPTAPCAVDLTAYTQSFWFDGRYAVGCSPSGLEIYDPSTDAWSVLDAGPSPLSSRDGSAIAWTGSELIAWSGIVREPYNPTPDDGSAIVLPASGTD